MADRPFDFSDGSVVGAADLEGLGDIEPIDGVPADDDFDDIPQVRIYDLGHIELPQNTNTRKEGISKNFVMPFNGFIARVTVSWPLGANNAIGFNIEGRGPPKRLFNTGQLTREQATGKGYDLGFIIPANYPNPEFMGNNNTTIRFTPIEFVGQGELIAANVLNDANNNPHDIQIFMTVTNFDPRQILGSGTSGGTN